MVKRAHFESHAIKAINCLDPMLSTVTLYRKSGLIVAVEAGDLKDLLVFVSDIILFQRCERKYNILISIFV